MICFTNNFVFTNTVQYKIVYILYEDEIHISQKCVSWETPVFCIYVFE